MKANIVAEFHDSKPQIHRVARPCAVVADEVCDSHLPERRFENSPPLSPGGRFENSPAVDCRVRMSDCISPEGTAESPNVLRQLLLSVQDKGSPENSSTVPSGLWLFATRSHPWKGGLFSNLPPGDRCGLFSNLLSGRCESQTSSATTARGRRMSKLQAPLRSESSSPDTEMVPPKTAENRRGSPLFSVERIHSG